MNLIPETDQRLTTPCELFEFNDTIDLKELSADLLQFMMTHRGIGLAAVQVGLPHNLFVTAFEPYLFINPSIVTFSVDESKGIEGCLSFPGLVLPVYRKNQITVSYQNIRNELITQNFNGTEAKVIQHEMDHLAGITFKSRVSKLVLSMAEKKKQKFLNRRTV